MRTSDQIKAGLHHGAYELHQIQQLTATISDRIQTVLDEIQVCNDGASLIDPTIDTLNRQIHTLNEEMDRVYALRNDEVDSYVRQENAQLKRDLAALQEALRLEKEKHQAHLTDSIKSSKELTQRVKSLERFNELLKSKLNGMREQYESAIIDVVNLKDTVKSLQSTPAFSAIANTATSTDLHDGASQGPISFGKTVVETNRGLTVTIESSPDRSTQKASLHHGWIPQLPSGAAFPFPAIISQPQFTSPTPANGGSAQVATRTLGRPKACAIVKGTKEADESFERMKRTMTSSPLASPTKATTLSSSSASGLDMPIIRSFGVRLVTPSKVKSKLNPAVEAFAPSNSSGKDLANTGSMRALSLRKNEPPSKNGFKSSVTATTSKEEGLIAPHLCCLSKISVKEGPLTTTEKLSVKDKAKDQDTVAKGAKNGSRTESEPHQATSLATHILPHLRCLTNVIKNEDVRSSQVQYSGKGKNKADSNEEMENAKIATTAGVFVRPDPGLEAWLDSQETPSNDASTHESACMANGTLIEIDPNDSPKAGGNKTVPVPPGFSPISANDAAVETGTAAPIKIDLAASSFAVHDRVSYRNLTAEDEQSAPGHGVSFKAMSEKEKNAIFLAEYHKKLSTVSKKYGRALRQSSDTKEDELDPIKYGGAYATPPFYDPPSPIGTHELGALLDDECYRTVMKPRKAAKVEILEQQWKAVRKGGKVVYVL